MASQDVDDDLDNLLDSALEDFTHVSAPEAMPSSTLQEACSAVGCDVPEFKGQGSSSGGADVEEVKGLGMPALGKKKAKGKKVAGQKASSSSSSSASQSAESSSKEKAADPSKAGKRVTLEQLAERTRQTVEGIRAPQEAAGSRDSGAEGASDGVDEEEMVEKLVKQFEDMGTGDIQGLMDTMLQQLLSKDVLQEPMIEIRNRYPSWLSENSGKLSPEDLGRYTRQYECIRRLCHLYETSPNNFTQILEVMKEMQECGQPPVDIIQDLAPGLEIGEDGLPMLPNLGSGDLPPNCPTM